MNSENIKILPQNFVHCSRDDLIILIARMLNSLISINDNFNESNISPSNLTRFHSRTPPAISVYSYLARLARYSSLENAVLLTAVYYIDLLSTVYNSFTLNSLTVHRFLLTATTVGSKGLCDSFCTNSHYAKVGGIQANELDILERDFLAKVNYRILPRDFNIERCANDNRVVSASERKKSIDQLEGGFKAEQELQQAQAQAQAQNQGQAQGQAVQSQSGTVGSSNTVGTTSDDSISNLNRDYNSMYEKNAGYNVLDLYYQKMVALVGKETSIDDKQLSESFMYEINNQQSTDAQREFEDKNLIKTDPDTLPDQFYNKMIQSLITAYKDHMKNMKKKQHPSIQQVKNSEPPSMSSNNNNNNNNNVNSSNNIHNNKNNSIPNNLPKSPLKRSIDETISTLPKGKRSGGHPNSG